MIVGLGQNLLLLIQIAVVGGGAMEYVIGFVSINIR